MIYHFNRADQCITLFNRVWQASRRLAQLVDANHDNTKNRRECGRREYKRVIILINYSVGITINGRASARGKVYSTCTSDSSAKYVFPRGALIIGPINSSLIIWLALFLSPLSLPSLFLGASQPAPALIRRHILAQLSHDINRAGRCNRVIAAAEKTP